MDETACTEEGKIDGFSSAWSSSEDFVDSNGDGRYNTAEAFIIDVNGNGIPEQGEYIDAYGNGQYDEAESFTDTNGNGVWDDGLCTITEYLSFYAKKFCHPTAFAVYKFFHLYFFLDLIFY